MKEFVITLSDDLDIFESLLDAEKYFEPWILQPRYNFRAFDQRGNVLMASAQGEAGIKLTITNENKSLLLKEEILNYIPRLGAVNMIEFRRMSINALIMHLIKIKGFTK